jgi:hypothetical protein
MLADGPAVKACVLNRLIIILFLKNTIRIMGSYALQTQLFFLLTGFKTAGTLKQMDLLSRE